MLSSSLSSSLSELLSSELSLSEGGCRSGRKKAICFPLTRSCAALIPHDRTVAEGSQSPHLVTLAQNPGLPYFGAGACLVILLTILYKSTRMNSWSFNTSRRLTVFDNLSSSKQPLQNWKGGMREIKHNNMLMTRLIHFPLSWSCLLTSLESTEEKILYRNSWCHVLGQGCLRS